MNTMNIVLNGEMHELADNACLDALIESLGLSGRRIAVEVNLKIVPRSQYDSYVLKAGDKVEVVQAIGGG